MNEPARTQWQIRCAFNGFCKRTLKNEAANAHKQTKWQQQEPGNQVFYCSNYKGNWGTCPSTHYVRVDFLEQVVLGEIRRLTQFASRYEADLVKAAIGQAQQDMIAER